MQQKTGWTKVDDQNSRGSYLPLLRLLPEGMVICISKPEGYFGCPCKMTPSGVDVLTTIIFQEVPGHALPKKADGISTYSMSPPLWILSIFSKLKLVRRQFRKTKIYKSLRIQLSILTFTSSTFPTTSIFSIIFFSKININGSHLE